MHTVSLPVDMNNYNRISCKNSMNNKDFILIAAIPVHRIQARTRIFAEDTEEAFKT